VKPFKHHELLLPYIQGRSSERLNFAAKEEARESFSAIAAHYGVAPIAAPNGLKMFAIRYNTPKSKTGELILVLTEFTYYGEQNGKCIPTSWAIKFSHPKSHKEIEALCKEFGLKMKKFVPASLR
jgi:hypothetical protein